MAERRGDGGQAVDEVHRSLASEGEQARELEASPASSSERAKPERGSELRWELHVTVYDGRQPDRLGGKLETRWRQAGGTLETRWNKPSSTCPAQQICTR